MSAIVELTEAQRSVSTQALTWPEQAAAIRVVDEQTYTMAGTMLRGVKGLMKEADNVFDPAVKKAHEAHKAIVAAKNAVVAPLREAETILKRGLADYTAEQERRRLEEERRLQLEADRKAAEERKRLEDERKAELAKAALEGAAKLNAVAAQPAPPPPLAPVVRLTPQTPKVSGVSTRTIWRAEVVDFAALVRYVADHAAEDPNVLSFLTVNLTPLTGIARGSEGKAAIPGVTFRAETVVASR